MSAYAGRYAELYDLFYADKDYAVEAGWIDRRLREEGVRDGAHILDVACGTGSHALALARLGHQLTGVDVSEGMTARARAKADDAGIDATFLTHDMRTLPVLGPFDGATCLFDSLGYAVTNSAILEALRGIRRSLRDGALLIVEFWHAAAMLRSHDATRVRRFSVAGSDVVRISETTLAVEDQVSEVRYTVIEGGPDGTSSTSTEVHRNRWFLVQEMDLLLTSAGYSVRSNNDGFTDEPVSLDTWHVVTTAVAT